MTKKLKHIELFAGCGGMSLGLKAAGFDLYFANELSPMAAETYAFNILDENLQEIEKPQKTLWLKSQFKRGDKSRLRENPHEAIKGTFSDLSKSENLEEKMVVGDIYSLLDFFKRNPAQVKKIKNKIDLISGGPPCQSFSLAGRREKGNKRNQLPWAFAEITKLIKPKLVLLENVSGILRAFTDGDTKYYAWFEVAKAFGEIGYVPICMHVNAKYFGLPQNRPRFILLGIRKNLIRGFRKDDVLKLSKKFVFKLKLHGEKLQQEDIPEFKYFELNKSKDIPYFKDSLLLPYPTHLIDTSFLNVKYGIDKLKELKDNFEVESIHNDDFNKLLEEAFGDLKNREHYITKNHNHRTHSVVIQDRFKLLRIIEDFENGTKNKLVHALKTGSINSLDNVIIEELILRMNGINNIQELAEFFQSHKSRKHSQRALKAEQPAPAALSIPDDVCHYDPEQNRTLTIREMARIQSFPDWFEFRSKDTTGGKNRRFEVPNYTQVGNAVPPLLAKSLGEWLVKLLEEIQNER